MGVAAPLLSRRAVFLQVGATTPLRRNRRERGDRREMFLCDLCVLRGFFRAFLLEQSPGNLLAVGLFRSWLAGNFPHIPLTNRRGPAFLRGVRLAAAQVIAIRAHAHVLVFANPSIFAGRVAPE